MGNFQYAQNNAIGQCLSLSHGFDEMRSGCSCKASCRSNSLRKFLGFIGGKASPADVLEAAW